MILVDLAEAAEAAGLILRGGFHPTAEEGLPDFPSGRRARTLILLGTVGRDGWEAFAKSREAMLDPDPLDAWNSAGGLAPGRGRGRRAAFPLRRAALLALPTLGDARRAGCAFAARHPDPSRVRALARLSRSAPLRRGDRATGARGCPQPLRKLPGPALPDRLSGRRLHRNGLPGRGLRGAYLGARRSLVHGGRLPGARRMPGRPQLPLCSRAIRFHMRAFRRARQRVGREGKG